MNKKLAKLTVSKSEDYYNKVTKALEDAGFIIVLDCETTTERYYIIAKSEEGMNDRLHKSIYGQTLDEMKEDKGAREYEQDYICNTCKHHNKDWNEEPCDGCCYGNHSRFEPQESEDDE